MSLGDHFRDCYAGNRLCISDHFNTFEKQVLIDNKHELSHNVRVNMGPNDCYCIHRLCNHVTNAMYITFYKTSIVKCLQCFQDTAYCLIFLRGVSFLFVFCLLCWLFCISPNEPLKAYAFLGWIMVLNSSTLIIHNSNYRNILYETQLKIVFCILFNFLWRFPYLSKYIDACHMV